MPNNRKYFAFQKFNRLTLIEEIVSTKTTSKWLCLCDCGNYKILRVPELKSGIVKSCGCLVTDRKFIHTSSDKKIHQVFHSMKSRCYNKKNKQYKDYGGRGISICQEWLDDVKVFMEWVLNNGWSEGLAIDRIDNNGNYHPKNCRFVTQTINSRNTRSNIMIQYNNETKCLSEWCEYLNLSYRRSYDRLNRLRWSVERAFRVA